ncbi:MAG: hypothetical protein CMD85_03865 [Gammaproteobacteria bacterium]|nr:hypothetical protein [Gammaproteobacteria bacterium]|tara:strand:- start:651 stop:1289 length:639 start_codon:yes stop_codon:yes gene_type:complete
MVKLSSTEEENTEFLASLWQGYKYLLLLIVVAVVGGLVGWEAWNDNRAYKLQSSSDLYQSFLDSVDNKDLNETKIAEKILDNYPNTLYADLVNFHLVQVNLEENKLDESERILKKILEKHSSRWSDDYNPVEATAVLRLARVLIAKGSPLQAIELIDGYPYINGAFLEVKGDAQVEMSQFSEAKLNYLKALESTQNTSIKSLIKMKLADLGE